MQINVPDVIVKVRELWRVSKSTLPSGLRNVDFLLRGIFVRRFRVIAMGVAATRKGMTVKAERTVKCILKEKR
jgi:hypothetical protein